MDFQEFVQVFDQATNLIPSTIWTPEQVEAWYRFFSKYSVIEFAAALNQAILKQRNSTFPSVGSVQEYLDIYTGKNNISIQNEASKVVGNILGVIKKYGSWREVEALKSLDDVSKEVVNRFGFQNLCTIQYQDLPTIQAQLRKTAEGILIDNRNVKLKKEFDNDKNNIKLLPDNLKKLINSVVEKK